MERLRLKVANDSTLDAQVAAVQSLLQSAAFARALAVHNKVQQVWSSLQRIGGPQALPVTADAGALVRNVSEKTAKTNTILHQSSGNLTSFNLNPT